MGWGDLAVSSLEFYQRVISFSCIFQHNLHLFYTSNKFELNLEVAIAILWYDVMQKNQGGGVWPRFVTYNQILC